MCGHFYSFYRLVQDHVQDNCKLKVLPTSGHFLTIHFLRVLKVHLWNSIRKKFTFSCNSPSYYDLAAAKCWQLQFLSASQRMLTRFYKLLCCCCYDFNLILMNCQRLQQIAVLLLLRFLTDFNKYSWKELKQIAVLLLLRF